MSQPSFYLDYGTWLSRKFPGLKVQKLAVNAGLGCPNRDGSIGRGGCAYCNNDSFNPGYCSGADIALQLEKGKQFFARKYPRMKYLAYFQAYTNTHGDSSLLLDMYRRALEVPDIVGIIIATRPDCLPEHLIDRLAELARTTTVIVELGAESSHDVTLDRVNRCHHWSHTVDTVTRLHAAGIPVGLHLIMGLPGESREMMLQTIDRVNLLPVDTVKIHQLQIIKGTRLARDIEQGKENVVSWTADEYIDLCCDIVDRLRPDIAIERFVSQSPDELLISPRWGLKNYQFTDRLKNRLSRRLSR